jgi:hypothetical protein
MGDSTGVGALMLGAIKFQGLCWSLDFEWNSLCAHIHCTICIASSKLRNICLAKDLGESNCWLLRTSGCVCSLLNMWQCFGTTYCTHHQGILIILPWQFIIPTRQHQAEVRLVMEALASSETSSDICYIVWSHNRKDRSMNIDSLVKLETYKRCIVIY